MVEGGFTLFDPHPAVLRWARAAKREALRLSNDPQMQARHLRHGRTWFVGVDVLPNDESGAINGVPLEGPWQAHVIEPARWHQAQLSILYPGYPRQDPDESDANHGFRKNRFAAHVDGLLPVGSDRRRYLKEPHAFILGLPLNDVSAAPLVVYPDSHRLIGEALTLLADAEDPTEVDLTDAYVAARREVFARIDPVPLPMRPGQSVLLHRHLLHGVAPWAKEDERPQEGRMVAYFRPQFAAKDWIKTD